MARRAERAQSAVTLERQHSAEAINAIVNHPSVYRWVAGPDMAELDLTPLVSDPNNVLLMTDRGGFLFVHRGDGVYEVHTQFLPRGRVHALDAARAAAAWMFEQTDCRALVTYVPDGNVAARALTERVGFEWRDRRGEWTYPDGSTVEIDWYELTKDTWTCQ